MKFEDSIISKQLKLKLKKLSFGKLYFHPKFVIVEINYGIHLDWKKIEKLIQAISLHYGAHFKIGYISNKTNSYSFEPNLWTKFYDNYDFIIASASVCYSHINYINATIEKQFSKNSVKRTDNLNDAIQWITNLDEFN